MQGGDFIIFDSCSTFLTAPIFLTLLRDERRGAGANVFVATVDYIITSSFICMSFFSLTLILDSLIFKFFLEIKTLNFFLYSLLLYSHISTFTTVFSRVSF